MKSSRKSNTCKLCTWSWGQRMNHSARVLARWSYYVQRLPQHSDALWFVDLLDCGGTHSPPGRGMRTPTNYLLLPPLQQEPYLYKRIIILHKLPAMSISEFQIFHQQLRPPIMRAAAAVRPALKRRRRRNLTFLATRLQRRYWHETVAFDMSSEGCEWFHKLFKRVWFWCQVFEAPSQVSSIRVLYIHRYIYICINVISVSMVHYVAIFEK